MSMQDGYLTLLTYDNSLARRRKHRARLRQRRMLVNFAFFMAVTGAFVVVAMGGAGLF